MHNKVIRVAQVIGMAINGGTEALWMNYYNHIDKSKVQFDFLVESTSKIIDREKIESMGGRVVIIPPYTNPFKYMKELKKIFKENNYDIVHSNMSTLSIFVLRSAKKAGIKVRIAHSHSTSNKKEWKKNILKNLLRPFSKIYPTHYFACGELAGRYLFGNKTFDNGKVAVINNAIDMDKCRFNLEKRELIRNELGINEEVVLGHIGRMQAQKNQSYLIDIFNNYHKLNSNSKLLILGDGPLKETLVNKVNSLGLTDVVIFAGVKTNPEDYYSAMDCFVLPSLYEGLPVVGIETQANGLPCYFANTITEEVKFNDNVYFLPISVSPKEWAEKIHSSGMVRDNVKENSKYDIKIQAKMVEEMYKGIVDKII